MLRRDFVGRGQKFLGSVFAIHADQADVEAIDSTLRNAIAFRGTNVWLLICAIFIASIGLNVNSTAVIIGAMLVSPLMGPIMGIGYSVAIADFTLMRRSATSLSIAVAISLLTSTIYFTLSPLTDAHSELLARTTPTVWDVLARSLVGLREP